MFGSDGMANERDSRGAMVQGRGGDGAGGHGRSKSIPVLYHDDFIVKMAAKETQFNYLRASMFCSAVSVRHLS